MAATRRQRAGLVGVSKLRRTLRRLEPEMLTGIKTEFEKGAQAIEADMLSNAMALGLYDTGDMVDAISYKMGRDGLTGLIGPGASHMKVSKSPFNTTLYKTKPSKHMAMQFFKAYWAEFGTKAGKRGGPQPATPFVTPAFDANKDWIAKNTRDEIGKVLMQVSAGDGSNRP